MAIPKERIKLILGRFSLLFPLPVADYAGFDQLASFWEGLFSDCNEPAFNAAAKALALRLKRFPFPADFVEEIAAASQPKVQKD